MTAVREQAIEAGARAIVALDHYVENEWQVFIPDAAAVVDAVEPIIRADEDRQAGAVFIIDRAAIEAEVRDEVWNEVFVLGVFTRHEAEVRERIAQEIEAAHERAGDECYGPGMGALVWCQCSHFDDAAIARGGAR